MYVRKYVCGCVCVWKGVWGWGYNDDVMEDAMDRENAICSKGKKEKRKYFAFWRILSYLRTWLKDLSDVFRSLYSNIVILFYLPCQIYSVMWCWVMRWDRCLRDILHAMMVNSMPIKCLSHVLGVIGLRVWGAVRTTCSFYTTFSGFHGISSAYGSIGACVSSHNATRFIPPKKELNKIE